MTKSSIKRLWDRYPLAARVWLADYAEDDVFFHLEEGVDTQLLRAAIRMANGWLYGRDSANREYGTKGPVEMALRESEPERYAARRLAFTRHVLATLAGHYPELVEELTEAP